MMNINIEDGECIISGIDYNGYAFDLRMYSSEWRVIREHIETEAVAAERRRVWDAITDHITAAQLGMGEKRTYEESERADAHRVAFVIIQDYLFPDGEPKEVNPPAGERRGDE